MKLSVIIPTYNRSNLLNKSLQSIASQTFQQNDFEVLVIDNGSKDNTKDIVDSFKKSILNLRCFYDETPGLHTGRHIGLKEAQADILVFADDDIEAFPTWLEGIWESFQDNSVMLVGGKNLPLFESPPPFWIWAEWNVPNDLGKVYSWLSILDFGNEIMEIDPVYVFGCNFSIRKEILIQTGGFHPDSMPQDLIRFRGDGETYVSNYMKEKQLKAIYNPKASVHHKVPEDRMTHDYILKRVFNQGISDSFSDLRKGKSITRRKINKLVKAIRILSGFELYKMMGKLIKDQNKTNFQKELDNCYWAGYSYHQHMYRKDPGIKEWVHKENYL